MSAMAFRITCSIVSSTVCSGADQRKHQTSASLASVRGIHRWPMNSPHKGPVTRKRFNLMTSSWYETRTGWHRHIWFKYNFGKLMCTGFCARPPLRPILHYSYHSWTEGVVNVCTSRRKDKEKQKKKRNEKWILHLLVLRMLPLF